MTKEFHGDLLDFARDGYFDVIIHGCNCFCKMGSGIAKQIKEEYPEAYQADCDWQDPNNPVEGKMEIGNINKLGNFTYANTKDGFRIINAYTQYEYGSHLRPLDYEAITLALRKVNAQYRSQSVGLPMIGAGLAGGDWVRIKKIIERELKDMPVTIVYYKKK